MNMVSSAVFLGFCSALGIFITLLRCPRMIVLHIFGYAWVLDIIMSALMFAMHWGTAIGGFSAVIASLFCSVGISMCKKTIGHMDGTTYVKGWFGDCRPVHLRK